MTLLGDEVATWVDVCAVDALLPGRGVAALIGSVQVAIFQVPGDNAVYAISNYDPFSHAFVMSRGIVGSKGDVPKVASPIYKQTFDLRTGVCLDDESVSLETYAVRVVDGRVPDRHPVTLLSAVAAVDEATPVDHWLRVQADMSAVERFSQRHDAHVGPVQERYYRDLMPATQPGVGQQYAFAVDLDACTGCKACVAACNSLNGLDEGEQWRKVTRPDGMQHVTAACHHCADAACMNGCPVDAYEKDPVTGIVKHLDDQCIGCSYCTLTCPYEVPSFNHRLGIVRKCDMCSDRLADGEAPACVQGCPNQAIAITVVNVADILDRKSTTQYTSSHRGCIHASAGEEGRRAPRAGGDVGVDAAGGGGIRDGLRAAHLHRPQRAALRRLPHCRGGRARLGASVFHLGRPQYAYRAVIGLRHSWLSREIVAFGAFMGLAVPYAAAVWLGWSVEWLGAATALVGIAGVVCSVLIYTVTGRASWTPLKVTVRFFGGAAIAGVTTVAWAASLVSGNWLAAVAMTLALALVVVVQLYERHRFTRASRPA